MSPALPRRPEALLLDFDGVILQSVEIKDHAFAEIYRNERPEQVAKVLSYQQTHGGVSRRVKFDYFERTIFGRTPSSADIERLAAQFSEIALRAVIECPFVAGAEHFLRVVQGRAALHVISGTPQDELDYIVETRELRGLFATVIGAPTTKPEAFKTILERYGYSIDRVLALGDSLTEYDAACILQIPFLGVVSAEKSNPFPNGVAIAPSLESVDSALGF